MKRILFLLAALMACTLSWADVKVVYHLSEGIPQASRAIGNIRNHLNADPKTKIVVVAHGLGIDFLLDGATNQMDLPFAGSISELASKGVEFRVWLKSPTCRPKKVLSTCVLDFSDSVFVYSGALMKFTKVLVAISLFILTGWVHAQAPSATQIRSWAAACANCHGTNGQAQPGMESLAGVSKDDIVKKMLDFKAGRKPATIMHQLAKGYSDDQIQAIAAYFAAQKK
jgi:cytochrome c553